MPENAAMSDRTRVVREPIRAVYDRDAIYAILDEGFVCHVGFTADAQTFVIPTMYARVGDAIYFHGSAASRMLRGVTAGLNVALRLLWPMACPGAFGLQSLHELPLSSRAWQRRPG